MLSETGLRLFETHMEVTEAENRHRTALWALKLHGGYVLTAITYARCYTQKILTT